MHVTSFRRAVRCALLLAGLLAPVERAAATDEPLYPQAMIPTPWQVGRFALLDANQDGLLDAILANTIGSVTAISRQPYGWRDPVTLSFGGLNDIETGDFSGDGDDDLVARTNSSLKLMLGHGDGSFGPANTLIPAQQTGLIEAADADGDGDLDLIAAVNPTFSNPNNFVLFNDGAAQFTAGPNLALGAGGLALKAADFNADGVLDYALARNLSGGQILLARGLGGGSFASWTVVAAPSIRDFVVCRLNADAWPDLAWVCVGLAGAQTRVAVGPGSFAPAVPVGGLPATGELVDIAAGDVDADGDDDLGFVDGNTIPNAPSWVAITTGGVPTVPASGVIPHGWAIQVALADVDGDGRADLCTSNSGLTISRSLGPSPAFEQPVAESLPPGTSTDVASADFDLDGDEDLVLSLAPAQPFARVLPSLGDGHYGAPTDSGVAPLGRWRPRAAGDVTGDGLPDAVGYLNATTALPKDIVVMVGTGTNVLLSGAWLGLSSPVGVNGVGMADLDQDGDLDLAVATTSALTVGTNDGTGSFSTTNIAGSTGRATAGDVDGDGLADVVGVVYSSPVTVEFHRNLGGSFAVPEIVLQTGTTNAVQLGDVDGDGSAELGLSVDGPGAVTHLTGMRRLPGGGWVTVADVSFPNGGSMVLLPMKDVTGDGLADLRGLQGSTLVSLTPGGSGGSWQAHYARLGEGVPCSLDADGDGTADVALLTGSDQSNLVPVATGISTGFAHGGQSWWTLGHGLAGANGRPVLVGGGELLPGQPTTLDLLNGRPSSPAIFVAGLDGVLLPFKSGTLVPAPDAVIALATDAQGEIHLGLPWPAGLPSQFDLFLQVWVKDPTAPSGFTASDALRIVTP